jgi:hypothetical protein
MNVAAACTADLSPGGIAIFFSDIKVVITNVDQVGGAALTALDSHVLKLDYVAI